MSEFPQEADRTSFLRTDYSFNQHHNFWIRANAPPFSYSDGEAIEQQLLAIVQSASDVSVMSTELRQHAQKSWPLKYHLHARRANLLRPVQQLLAGKVLEVGAGCGAITRFLGEVGGEIVAIEGSERRAAVAAARCRDLPNVTVVVDQFHQVPVTPRYDVVTLIGVLEYARLYFPAETGIDPVDALLARAQKFLKPNGVLILAIENQLGLKYFAGYAEDHTGQLMQNIEDRYAVDGVVTFGRVELAQRLSSSGFTEQQWWFPYPDYKLPTLLLSEYLLTQNIAIDIAPMLSSALEADPQSPECFLFSLEQASQAISRNKLFGDLANSFLVIAGAKQASHPQDIIGYHYATDRRAEFSKSVAFVMNNGKVQVHSKRLYPQAVFSKDIPLTLVLSPAEYFVEGDHWQQKFYQIVNQPGWTMNDLTVWAKIWLEAFLRQADLAVLPTVNTMISGKLLDALPRNLIIKKDGTTTFIDQEWQLQRQIEFGYVVFRALLFSFLALKSTAATGKDIPLKVSELFFKLSGSLGIMINFVDLQRYLSLENDLLYWVCGIENIYLLNKVQEYRLTIRVATQDKIEEVNTCHEQIRYLEKKLYLMENSCSWKISYPLRWLKKLYKHKN